MITPAPRRIRSWLKSRPYHLTPWIMLLALAPFAFPRRAPPPPAEPAAPPPGLSEDRVLPPDEFDTVEPLRGRAAGADHALVRGPRPRPRPTMWRYHHRAACEQMGAPRCPAAADLGRAGAQRDC